MKRLTEYAIPETGFAVVSEEKYKRILMEEKPSAEKVYNRLKKIEDILGEEYDLDRLSVLCNQRMTMREEVSQRFSLTAKIPLDRLRELAEADREGRCVVLPRLEPGQGDPIGDKGVEGPPGLCPNCNDYRGLVWDKVTGCSRCTICGWTNAKT